MSLASASERLRIMFISWKSTRPRTYRTRRLRVKAHGGDVSDRQSKIRGFSQDTQSNLGFLIAGAGGLGSHVGEGEVRKGAGSITLCDADTVEPSNLNRQKFGKADIWKNKALRLAKNLVQESFLGTTIKGIPLKVMEAVRLGLVGHVDCIISCIDDELAREELAEYALSAGVPLITTAVSYDGDGGYVHVQKPGEACWGCAFPREKRLRDDLKNYRAPCPGSPAIKDILMLVSGAAVYAVDTLFMDRPISWNYREFHLAGFMPDVVLRIERRPDCQLCGSGNIRNERRNAPSPSVPENASSETASRETAEQGG